MHYHTLCVPYSYRSAFHRPRVQGWARRLISRARRRCRHSIGRGRRPVQPLPKRVRRACACMCGMSLDAWTVFAPSAARGACIPRRNFGAKGLGFRVPSPFCSSSLRFAVRLGASATCALLGIEACGTRLACAGWLTSEATLRLHPHPICSSSSSSRSSPLAGSVCHPAPSPFLPLPGLQCVCAKATSTALFEP